MSSPEIAVLSGLPPDTDSFELQNTSTTCPEHGLAKCAACAARIERVRAIAEARSEQSSQPAEAVPDVVEPHATPPKPITEPEIVTLARAVANAESQLAREEKLLICAQLRVENLTASIAELKTATEQARSNLAAFVTANK